MKSDKLECLLDSFIASRFETDTVDAVSPKEWKPQNLMSKCADIGFEDPLTSLNGGQFPFEITGGSAGEIATGVEQGLSLAYAVQSTQVTDVGRQLRDLAVEFSMSQPDRSCVKFEKSCIIVAPEEQTISIPIIRSDPSSDKIIKIAWNTLDKTALSGIHYSSSTGEIIFSENEKIKTIEIKILKSEGDGNMDLRFNVEMSVDNEIFLPKPMTISLKKLDNFYDDERQVIRNFPLSPPFTVEDINCVLGDSLTIRTFHMALTHLCSAADSVHMEFALAFDLSKLCMKHLRRDCILKVLENFFRTEDIDC